VPVDPDAGGVPLPTIVALGGGAVEDAAVLPALPHPASSSPAAAIDAIRRAWPCGY
jgi:hypothetical protein